MSGQPETLFFSENGAVAEVARGEAGAALINFSDQPQSINISTTLPDGSYEDAVSKNTFKVKDGIISGDLNPLTTYILEII